MKRIRTKEELAATAAARKQGRIYLLIGLAVGIVMLLLSPEFMLMNTVVMTALAISGGLVAARAAMLHRVESALSAGSIGGLWATLGFALPFSAYFYYRYYTLTEAAALQRLSQMSVEQQTYFRNIGITLGTEFVFGEYISYIFYYLFFALIAGWMLGMIGAAITKRSLKNRGGL